MATGSGNSLNWKRLRGILHLTMRVAQLLSNTPLYDILQRISLIFTSNRSCYLRSCSSDRPALMTLQHAPPARHDAAV